MGRRFAGSISLTDAATIIEASQADLGWALDRNELPHTDLLDGRRLIPLKAFLRFVDGDERASARLEDYLEARGWRRWPPRVASPSQRGRAAHHRAIRASMDEAFGALFADMGRRVIAMVDAGAVREAASPTTSAPDTTPEPDRATESSPDRASDPEIALALALALETIDRLTRENVELARRAGYWEGEARYHKERLLALEAAREAEAGGTIASGAGPPK